MAQAHFSFELFFMFHCSTMQFSIGTLLVHNFWLKLKIAFCLTCSGELVVPGYFGRPWETNKKFAFSSSGSNCGTCFSGIFPRMRIQFLVPYLFDRTHHCACLCLCVDFFNNFSSNWLILVIAGSTMLFSSCFFWVLGWSMWSVYSQFLECFL